MNCFNASTDKKVQATGWFQRTKTYSQWQLRQVSIITCNIFMIKFLQCKHCFLIRLPWSLMYFTTFDWLTLTYNRNRVLSCNKQSLAIICGAVIIQKLAIRAENSWQILFKEITECLSISVSDAGGCRWWGRWGRGPTNFLCAKVVTVTSFLLHEAYPMFGRRRPLLILGRYLTERESTIELKQNFESEPL